MFFVYSTYIHNNYPVLKVKKKILKRGMVHTHRYFNNFELICEDFFCVSETIMASVEQ